MPFPPPSSHLYLPSRLPRPSSSISYTHSNTPWPYSHPPYPSRPHSAPTSQERTPNPAPPLSPSSSSLHWLDPPSNIRPPPTDYDSDFETPPAQTETSQSPLYPYPYFGSIPLITTSSSTSYENELEDHPHTPRPTQTSFLPSDLMYDPPPPPPPPRDAALSERIRYRTHLQQRTLTFNSSSAISPSSSTASSSSETTTDPYRSWPSPRRRPPLPPLVGAFVSDTLPEAIRGYARHAGWLDDVYRVGGAGMSSGRLVRGRDIVRDREVFPGVGGGRAVKGGDLEPGETLVCGGSVRDERRGRGEVEYFFSPSSVTSTDEGQDDEDAPNGPARRPPPPRSILPEQGCNTPIFHHPSTSTQPISHQTLDFLEILLVPSPTSHTSPTRTQTHTEHAWSIESGYLLILSPSTSTSTLFDLLPPTETSTRSMGCGCLLSPSLVCLNCGNALGYVLGKTCSRHTHPMAPLAPDGTGAKTLLFDGRAVRVKSGLVKQGKVMGEGRRERSRTTTGSSDATLVGSEEDVKWVDEVARPGKGRAEVGSRREGWGRKVAVGR